jgi:hypothetical protein
MQIDPNANIAAFGKLADTTGETKMQVGMSVAKQVMESAEAATMQLLASMTPHLGQKVDVQV